MLGVDDNAIGAVYANDSKECQDDDDDEAVAMRKEKLFRRSRLN